MTRRVEALLAGLAVLASACARSERDTLPQAGAAGPGPVVLASTTAAPSVATSIPPADITSTTTAAPPRPPALPATAILRAAVAVEPAARLPLTPGAEVVVHPTATFEVELSARVADAQLSLVDARDDLVPASATREVGAGTKLTLSPAAPLVPASRYVLRLEGLSDRELHDDAGRAFAGLTLPLLAAGDPPPPEPKKAAKKRRRR